MVTAPLRIVFFGTPAFAVDTLEALLRSRHNVVAVVSQPDRPKGRGHKLLATPTRAVAALHGVPVLQPATLREEATLEAIAACGADLGVVAAYGRILPARLLQVPPLGMINVHGSLLPAYRGAAPVHRAVIAGEEETGVTIMRVVLELDAGPMLDMAVHPIGPNDTSVDVERALAALGATRLLHVVDRIAAGTAVETPQDDARATYALKIEKSEGRVDWTRPARDIHNLVRGLQPWPLVSLTLADTRCLLHRTALVIEQHAAAPGTIVSAAAPGIDVACGGGAVLRILDIQPEGRRVMSAREFLAGRPLGAGTRIE